MLLSNLEHLRACLERSAIVPMADCFVYSVLTKQIGTG